METKTIALDVAENGDIIAANEKPLITKAVMTIFSSMDSKSEKVALAAAEAALRIYGKDQPAKKENTVPFLACFSKPEQLVGLLQGLLGMAELAIDPNQTPAAMEAPEVHVEVIE